jgi:hypothetical protein
MPDAPIMAYSGIVAPGQLISMLNTQQLLALASGGHWRPCCPGHAAQPGACGNSMQGIVGTQSCQELACDRT